MGGGPRGLVRRRLALALFVVVVWVALPLVDAAHVHDHRYMVVGRVLDGQRLPAGFVSVRGELLDAPSFVPAQVAQTNCLGDFVLVYSASDLADASLRLTVNDRSSEHALDLGLRRTVAKLDVPGTFAPRECVGQRANFTQRHVVTGRLIGDGGQPRVSAEVSVTLALAGGPPLEASGATNEAGDFAIGFQSGRLGAGGTAVVTDGRSTWQEPLDTTYHMTVADHVDGDAPSLVWPILAGALALLAAGGLLYLYFVQRNGP